MKRHVVLAFSLLAAFAVARHPLIAAAGDFDSAKALYAAASYEEALATLEHLQSAADPIQVNEYRALCLLALGRARDAEAPLQQIVTTNPLYTIPAAEVSPRLVDLFRDVRKRTLPAAARQLYGKAKASYDEKHLEEATKEFKTLLTVLKDPLVVDRANELSDLKDLAEGFLALTDAQLSLAKPAAPLAPAPAPAPVVASAAPSEPRIYGAQDPDVRPPVEIQRPMPSWMPTTESQKLNTFKGAIRVVVDEHGAVEAATIVTSIFPTYNADLLKATKAWRYQPAMHLGVPVKYALTIEIVLKPISGDHD